MGNGLCSHEESTATPSPRGPPIQPQAASSSQPTYSSPPRRGTGGQGQGTAGVPVTDTAPRPRVPMTSTTKEQRKQAEDLKAAGNALFTKQKFRAAAEKYTEAITLAADWAVLYVNRGMCHKKLEEWGRVLEDSQAAVRLDDTSMKGHYLLGLAHSHHSNHSLSVSHLKRALEQAREAGDSIKDEIWHELAKCSYSEWEDEAKRRKKQRDELKEQLCSLLKVQSPAHLPPGWNELFTAASARDTPVEVPSLFTCPLTMEIFRDPVVTPSGRTYEKSTLLEHLSKVGKFDPITRAPMTEKEVYPNLSMRAAIAQFLEEHPFAWGEA